MFSMSISRNLSFIIIISKCQHLHRHFFFSLTNNIIGKSNQKKRNKIIQNWWFIQYWRFVQIDDVNCLKRCVQLKQINIGITTLKFLFQFFDVMNLTLNMIEDWWQYKYISFGLVIQIEFIHQKSFKIIYCL